jgi:hypothetical protein
MSYVGFNKLKAEIASKGNVRDAGAVAASIGRKKYGKKKFQAAAAKGEKMKGMSAKRNKLYGSFIKKRKPGEVSDVRSSNPKMGKYKSKSGYAIPYANDTDRSPYKRGPRG